MNHTRTEVGMLRRAVYGLALAVFTVISACGGAIGSGGTGATAPSVGGGTVTGFGSIIIDGLRYDDQYLATTSEIEPGLLAPAEAKMGHRVEVGFDERGAASSLRLAATAVGMIASTSISGPQAGSFVVLGQTVTINADAISGPVTQFGGGLSSAQDLVVGAYVEVHGVARTSGTLSSIQATRIDRLAAPPKYLRVGGQLQQSSSAGSFMLGTLTIDTRAASISPQGGSLAVGSTVLAFAPIADLTHNASGGFTLLASELRIKSSPASGTETFASGVISKLDVAMGKFDLGGLTVQFNATAVQPKDATLANGQYVRAKGSILTDGIMQASEVAVRDGKYEPEAELKGNVFGYLASSGSFTIRGTSVTLTSTTRFENCPGGGLQDGLFVEIEGALASSGVVAKKIACSPEPAGAVVERDGKASMVDLNNRSFTLTPKGAAQFKVVWTDLTYFGGLTPQSLDGKSIEVEGRLEGSSFLATKIKLDD